MATYGSNGDDTLAGTSGSDVILGKNGDDLIIGSGGEDRLCGWGGDDTIFAIGTCGMIAGNAGNDYLEAGANGLTQIHMFGGSGNDTLVMDVSSPYAPFGHHAFGGTGPDRFEFKNVAAATERIVGRIDDFDPSEDSLWIDGKRIDLTDPPSDVRIVAHNGQQWILIGENILYAIEGARRDDAGRGGQEKHFIEWPQDWENGVPGSADVEFIDQKNFVPTQLYRGLKLGLERIAGGDDPTVEGSAGADLITGVESDQVILGNAGNDVINAGKGHDTVRGGDGDDSIAGGVDNDVLFGQSGADLLFGGSEHDRLVGGGGADTLFGGTGHDTLSGGRRNDRLLGEDGADRLAGGAGADRLIGGRGHDTLKGGGGDDTLVGGTGRDIFVFSGPSGDDLIKDFRDGIDIIRFCGGTVSSFADLTISDLPNKGAVVIDFDGGSVQLNNTSADQISSDDFLF